MFEIILWVLCGALLGGTVVGLWVWSLSDVVLLEDEFDLDKVKSNGGQSEPTYVVNSKVETRGRKKGTTPYKCRRCAGTEYVMVSKQRHCKPCWESSIEKRREYARKWYHANKKEKAGETE